MRAYRPPSPRKRPVGPPIGVPGRLIGVRTWGLGRDEEGALRLGSGDRRWRRDGESTWAECQAGGRAVHPPDAATPAGECTCGLYVLHPCRATQSQFWEPLLAQSLYVIGVAEAWGRVHVHEEGFRAQYARPIGLALLGASRQSGYGRLIEDLAIDHRAEVLEVASPEGLVAECERRGLGMRPGAIDAVLKRKDPKSVRVDGGPAPTE